MVEVTYALASENNESALPHLVTLCFTCISSRLNGNRGGAGGAFEGTRGRIASLSSGIIRFSAMGIIYPAHKDGRKWEKQIRATGRPNSRLFLCASSKKGNDYINVFVRVK